VTYLFTCLFIDTVKKNIYGNRTDGLIDWTDERERERGGGFPDA